MTFKVFFASWQFNQSRKNETLQRRWNLRFEISACVVAASKIV